MKSLTIIAILSAMIAAPSGLSADSIVFTDGTSVDGRLIRVTDTTLEYSTKENPSMTVRRSAVRKVTYSTGKTVIISSDGVKEKNGTDSAQNSVVERKRTVKETFDIAPVASYRSLKFYGNESTKDLKPFTLRPQAKIIPGIKTNFHGFGLSVFNSLPYDNNKISENGLTRFFEADGQYFDKFFGCELIYKKVNEFILEDNSKLWQQSSKHTRNDIKADYLRANLFISSSGRDYSLKNGIGNDGLPEDGFTGSIVLMLSAGYNSVKGIAPFDPRSTYYEKSILKDMKMYYLYALPGYAFSLSGYSCYASASVFLIGLGYTRSEYNDLGGTHGQKRGNLLQPACRFSAGYDSESFFAGGKFDYQSATADMNFKSPSFANMSFTAASIEWNIFAGVKF
jgi:hypothetical protein